MPILAIGGGDLAGGETLALDRFAVDLTGKRRVRALFVPTASWDSPGYCQSFQVIYGNRLGCEVSFLLLDSVDQTDRTIDEKLNLADLIYVGGGNTLRMMNRWRQSVVAQRLGTLAGSDKVLMGLSAGAICWHAFGHSDSRKGPASGYIKVTGLGLKPGIFCPHFDSEHREADFGMVVAKARQPGLACDDLAAVWYTGDRAVVKTAGGGAKVRLFQHRSGLLQVTEFGDGEELPAL